MPDRCDKIRDDDQLRRPCPHHLTANLTVIRAVRNDESNADHDHKHEDRDIENDELFDERLGCRFHTILLYQKTAILR